MSSGALPSFFLHLESLQFLLADSCGLAHLPTSFAGLGKLHTISLRRNALRSLPGWLCRLPCLETLLVDGNDFYSHWVDLVQPILVKSDPRSSIYEGTNDASMNDIALIKRAHSDTRILTSPRLDEEEMRTTSHDWNVRTASPTKGGLKVSIPSPGQFLGSTATSSYSSASLSPSAISVSVGSTSEGTTLSPSLSPLLDSTFGSSLSPIFSPTPEENQPASIPSTAATAAKVKSNSKWGALFKTVSKKKDKKGLRPSPVRTHSEPVNTRTLSTSGTGRRERNDDTIIVSKKRQSYLVLNQFPPLEVPIDVPLSSPIKVRSTRNDYESGLRALMAYLRDVDDLSFEATSGVTPTLRTAQSIPSTPTFSNKSFNQITIPADASSRVLSQYFHDGISESPSSTIASPAGFPLLTSKIRADAIKSSRVIDEILETEKTYLKGLEELCEVYVIPGGSITTSGKEAPIPINERKAVFGNVVSFRFLSSWLWDSADSLCLFFGHRLLSVTSMLRYFCPSYYTRPTCRRIELKRFQKSSFVMLDLFGSSFHSFFYPELKWSDAIGMTCRIYSAYVITFDSAMLRIQNWSIEPKSSPNPSQTPRLRSASSGTLTARLGPLSPTAGLLSLPQKKRIHSFLKVSPTCPKTFREFC
jgi:hypothetical protein